MAAAHTATPARLEPIELGGGRGQDPVAIRYLLARDPAGELPDTAYFCTEERFLPVEILTYVVQRWSVEVTFEEARAHLTEAPVFISHFHADHTGQLGQRQAEGPAVRPAEVTDVGRREVGALGHPRGQAGGHLGGAAHPLQPGGEALAGTDDPRAARRRRRQAPRGTRRPASAARRD